MIRFILNDTTVETDLPPGMILLDFLRYHQHLTGTKIGCREGDCGACTILVGSIAEGNLLYRSMTCCLMPLKNAEGKHIVTIEGINLPDLNPVQKAMADNGATQCGFCTPGFVMSLAGYCLSSDQSQAKARAAIDGNICRCTGYKSIERAADNIAELMSKRNSVDTIEFAINNKLVPPYFQTIKDLLTTLGKDVANVHSSISNDVPLVVSGGTDLYVQRHSEMVSAIASFKFNDKNLSGIRIDGDRCIIGASATVTDLKESPHIQKIFPGFNQFAKLISSTAIRNMATIAGNFVNASPIGDLTIFFLALDAQIVLKGNNGARTLPLRNFYKGYKSLDKAEDEVMTEIFFKIPPKGFLFNFEKVSKRTHLDIASVNTAFLIETNNNIISTASISAGGIGPIPTYLAKSSSWLSGRPLNESTVLDCINLIKNEISPISDARGSKEYKSLLLQQLIKSHFITLFPNLEITKLLQRA